MSSNTDNFYHVMTWQILVVVVVVIIVVLFVIFVLVTRVPVITCRWSCCLSHLHQCFSPAFYILDFSLNGLVGTSVCIRFVQFKLHCCVP